MTRDPTIPLFLWICAAICSHLLFGGGAEVVARIHDDKSYLARMASFARDRVRQEEATFEIAGLDVGNPSPEPQAPPPPPPPPPKPVASEKPAQVEPPKPAAKPEAKKEEPKKTVNVVIKPEPAKPLPPPPPQTDQRIAVRQHVKQNQEDNPNARFVGDEANHVDQETVATQTSHDKDEENPTPGGNHAGPNDHVGDSDRTKIAESEEHKGEKNRAPGEKGTEFEVQKLPPLETPPGRVTVAGPKTAQVPIAGGDGRQAAVAPPTPAQMAPGGAAPPSPEVTSSANGNWSFNPVRPNPGLGQAQDQGAGQATKSPLAPKQGTTSTTWLGLGGHPGPGQINLNLNQQGVVAAVGQDQLRKEREADGERRRSEHRGSWIASNFERWRSAIENYVSTVKPGNQTALNTAAVPFASYLNGMHNRIHPIFADNFLGSLDGLPKEHPLNDQKLITRLEIVVTRDGHLVKMGIVRTSGVTAFDIAALDSVQRASPFGPAPSAIVSPDGNVYLHWEFHRDEVYACSTMNARPFLLNVPPPSGAPPEPQPPGTPPSQSPTHERGAPPPVNTNETREGMLAPTVAHAKRS
jgi:TonB family protein